MKSKHIVISLLLLAVSYTGTKGQNLLNSGFENWSLSPSQDSVPDYWWGNYFGTIVKTTDSYAGAYAAVIKGVPMCGIAPGILNNGAMPMNAYCDPAGGGSAMPAKYSAFRGYYKNGNSCPGDSSVITVIFKKYNSIAHKTDTVAYGQLVLPPVATYSEFIVNINDLQPGIASDSVLIRMEASKYNCFTHDTAWNMTMPALYVDEVSLIREIPLGVGANSEKREVSLYPNPFSYQTTLELSGKILAGSVELFDMKGKLVKRIEILNSNKITIDRTGMANGMYMYRLSGENRLIEQGRLMIE